MWPFVCIPGVLLALIPVLPLASLGFSLLGVSELLKKYRESQFSRLYLIASVSAVVLYGLVCSAWPFFTIYVGPRGPWFVTLGHGLAGSSALLAAVALIKSSKRPKALELLALDDDPRWTFFLLGICIDVWLCSATNESIQSAFIDLIYGLELPMWLESIVVACVASSGVFYQLLAQYNAVIMLNFVLVFYPVLQFEDEMPADFQCAPTLMENFSRWKNGFLSLSQRFSISRLSEKFRSSGIVSILLLQAVNLRYLSCTYSGQMSLYESECWDREHTQFSLLFCALAEAGSVKSFH